MPHSVEWVMRHLTPTEIPDDPLPDFEFDGGESGPLDDDPAYLDDADDAVMLGNGTVYHAWIDGRVLCEQYSEAHRHVGPLSRVNCLRCLKRLSKRKGDNVPKSKKP